MEVAEEELELGRGGGGETHGENWWNKCNKEENKKTQTYDSKRRNSTKNFYLLLRFKNRIERIHKLSE